jgi:hypothetical protein
MMAPIAPARTARAISATGPRRSARARAALIAGSPSGAALVVVCSWVVLSCGRPGGRAGWGLGVPSGKGRAAVSG